MATKIRIDADKCIGSGVCAAIAPEVFDLDDAGIVVLLKDETDADGVQPVQEAATACPAWVIELDND